MGSLHKIVRRTVLLLTMAAPLAGASTPLRFIADDSARALAEAKQRHLPLFVEVWAPW